MQLQPKLGIITWINIFKKITIFNYRSHFQDFLKTKKKIKYNNTHARTHALSSAFVFWDGSKTRTRRGGAWKIGQEQRRWGLTLMDDSRKSRTTHTMSFLQLILSSSPVLIFPSHPSPFLIEFYLYINILDKKLTLNI